MSKFVIILSVWAFVAAVNAQGGGGGGGGGGYGHGHGHGEATSYGVGDFKSHFDHPKEIVYHDHPKYHFEYKVADPKHHDYHNQHEVRDGHKVKGTYSLLEPDGKTVRVVKYEADKKEGFRAQVEHQIHH